MGGASTGASSWYWEPRYGQYAFMLICRAARPDRHVWLPINLVGPGVVRLKTNPLLEAQGRQFVLKLLSPHKHEERV